MRAARLGREGVHREQLIEQCGLLLKTEVVQMGVEITASREQITLLLRILPDFKGKLRLAGERFPIIE